MNNIENSNTHPLRYRQEPQKKQSLLFFSMLMLSLLMAFAGVVAGFMYGDVYGRKHAQYDNPVLREYYAGQCYTYWETQFKKTVRQTLSKAASNSEQNARLEELRTMIVDVQQNINGLAIQKDPASKKKMVSTGQSYSGRVP